ncbi:hypothetical protein [Streptosporangium sp. 'caverna']|nr:hypothetical protein [Streptosporangium sp. 'caverna']
MIVDACRSAGFLPSAGHCERFGTPFVAAVIGRARTAPARVVR